MPPSLVTDARDGAGPFWYFTHRGFQARHGLRIAPAVARSDGTGRAGRATTPAATVPDRLLTPAGH
jgi:hypothetical protein